MTTQQTSQDATPTASAFADQPNPFKTIERGPDGKYRWVYELNMYKNPVIIFVLWKIFFFVFLGCFVFATLINLTDSWFGFADFLENGKMFLLLWLFFCVLSLLVYWAYAAIVYRGKYCVIFTLDDEGVEHRVLDKQYKKSQAINLVGAAIGMAAGNLTVAGSNLLAATKNVSSSSFAVVKSVVPQRWLNTIKVNELMEKNQVYVPKEDFDAMYQFILERCPNVKTKQ